MTRRLRDETGSGVATVLAILLALLALGTALVIRAQAQVHLSGYERTRESSFNIAEAALNAHALQLGRKWPTSASAPAVCDATVNDPTCPPASSLGAYSNAAGCPSSPVPIWQTSVRDNAAGEQYWSPAVSSRSAYDANNDGVVWLRSTGFVQCNRVSTVGLVTRNTKPLNFPNNVVSANWFATANQGRKVIVDTLGAYAEPASIRPGPASQPAPIVVRCSGLTSTQCLNYQADKGQVQPPAVSVNSGASSSIMSASQLQSLEQQAISAGTFWPSGSCPPNGSLNSFGAAPIVIEGPCDITVVDTQINSSASPGAVVIENGTFSIGGSSIFYGLVYCVNEQGSNGSVVTISGNASIQGIVAIDGAGGVIAGSSKTNIIYDPRAVNLLRGTAGAEVDKNSFRVLAQSTP